MSDFYKRIKAVSDKDTYALLERLTGTDRKDSTQKLFAVRLILAATRELSVPDDAPITDMFKAVIENMNDSLRDYAALALYLYSYNNPEIIDLCEVDREGENNIVYTFDIADFHEYGFSQIHRLIEIGFYDTDYPSVMFYGYLWYMLHLCGNKERDDIKNFLYLVGHVLNPLLTPERLMERCY